MPRNHLMPSMVTPRTRPPVVSTISPWPCARDRFGHHGRPAAREEPARKLRREVDLEFDMTFLLLMAPVECFYLSDNYGKGIPFRATGPQAIFDPLQIYSDKNGGPKSGGDNG